VSETSSGGPIFVVGASRSGTAMLRASLNRHPDVHIAGETHYFDDLRVSMGGREQAPLDEASRQRCEDYFLALAHRPYGHAGDPSASPLAGGDLRALADDTGLGSDAYFEAYCRLEAALEGRRPHARRWGEKTPRHVFRLGEMLTRYPTAQAVVMVRDPRAVVASYRDWRNQGGFDLEGDPSHAQALLAELRRTQASYEPSIASLLWKATIAAAEKARTQFGPERVRLQRYEDLVTEPGTTLEELASWLGVRFEASMLEVPVHNSSFLSFAQSAGHSTEPIARWKNKLSNREVAVVQLWCRRRMEDFGYDRETVQVSALELASIVVRLPPALLRAATANRHRVGSLPTYLWRRLRLATGR
jgi:hypothetical protein